MASRRPSGRLLALGLLLLAFLLGCKRDEFGDPIQVSVEEEAMQTDFGFTDSDLRLPEYRSAAGVKREECFEAYRHPTTLNMCVYTFGDAAQARDAAALAAKRKLPPGRYRTHLVRESTLYVIDCQLKDQPIADLLRSELERVKALVEEGG